MMICHCGRVDCTEHRRIDVTRRDEFDGRYQMAGVMGVAVTAGGWVLVHMDDRVAMEFKSREEVRVLVDLLNEAADKAWPAS